MESISLGHYGDSVVLPNYPKKGSYIMAGKPEYDECYVCRVVEENRDYLRTDTLVSVVCMVKYPRMGNTVDCQLMPIDPLQDGQLVYLRYMGKVAKERLYPWPSWRESVIKCLMKYREDASHYADSLQCKRVLTDHDRRQLAFRDALCELLDARLAKLADSTS